MVISTDNIGISARLYDKTHNPRHKELGVVEDNQSNKNTKRQWERRYGMTTDEARVIIISVLDSYIQNILKTNPDFNDDVLWEAFDTMDHTETEVHDK